MQFAKCCLRLVCSNINERTEDAVIEANRLILVTSEGMKVEADARMLEMSGLLKEVSNGSEIQLPNVSEPVLRKLMEYCERQQYLQPQAIKKPLSSDRIEEAVTAPWHAEFINAIDEPMLIDLVMAANYMDCKGIFDLCCAKIATMFKGKTVEELKQRYNITEDLTPQMDEQILKENPWITSDSANA